MRSKDEIANEIAGREGRIESLKARRDENAAEIQRISEQNTEWLSQNSDRERMPQSIATRREQSTRLTLENEDITRAISKLESEIRTLCLETEGTGGFAMLEAYERSVEEYLSAHEDFERDVQALIAAAKQLSEKALEISKRPSPLQVLERIVTFYGGSLDLSELRQGKIKPRHDENNSVMISEEVRKLVKFDASPLYDFQSLANQIRNIQGDPQFSFQWKRRLLAKLPAKPKQDARAHGTTTRMQRTITPRVDPLRNVHLHH